MANAEMMNKVMTERTDRLCFAAQLCSADAAIYHFFIAACCCAGRGNFVLAYCFPGSMAESRNFHISCVVTT